MKYKLTKETKDINGVKIYRIEALKSFAGVDKGDKGGWIENKENLSQEGNAWVSGDAWVYGNAQVSGNARVSGNAQVYGNAQVSGNAWVYGNAQVSGNAWVSGNAQVSGDAQVSGNAWVYGNAQVSGNAWVSGNAQVSGDAQVCKKIKLIGGYFYHTKRKSEKIEIVDSFDDDFETLARDPKIEKQEEENSIGKVVKIKINGGQIIEGEIVE